MAKISNVGRGLFRLMKKPPQLAYAIGLGPLIGRLVLLLTTTGRKSKLPRITPLQYEVIDGAYCVGAMYGIKADWVRNILVDPCVKVRVKNQRFEGRAEVDMDPAHIADFIEYRMQQHPRMLKAIMRADGFPADPTRADIEAYAENLALVKIWPV